MYNTVVSVVDDVNRNVDNLSEWMLERAPLAQDPMTDVRWDSVGISQR